MRSSFVLLVSLALLAAPITRCEDRLIVEPESDRVDVTTTFTGADVRIHGVIEPHADLVIKITGPARDVTLTREVRRGPFWIAGESAKVSGAPSLVYVYSTRPLAALLPAQARAKYGLDLEATALDVEPRTAAISEDRWRRAFFRLKEHERSYREDDHAIRITRERLVTTDIVLPPEAELGGYRVDALLVRDGRVTARDSGSFELRQVGAGRWVSDAARRHGWIFGVVCTLAAMVLGFGLNVALHRPR
ncbi:MAG: TIGR02186 family protein [Burkholderiales bacterium]|nr:TIGR02186 family protein [Burkholderiales bacterium]